MKKLLLFGAAAVCCTMSMSAESVKAEPVWVNTSIAANAGTMRGMAMSNGVMYVPNSATKKVEMWKDGAKIGDVPVDGTPMACFNIAADDAGNIIISMRDWAASPGLSTGFIGNNGKLFLINPDGSKTATINTDGGLPATRDDFFGHVRGDVFGEGATLFAAGMTSYDFKFSEVTIANGEYQYGFEYLVPGNDLPDGINDNKVLKTTDLDGVEGDGNATVVTPTTAVLGGYNMLGDNLFAAILPHFKVTSEYANRNPFCDGELGMGNSIFQVLYNEDEDSYALNNKFFRTPQHNACTGFDLFEMNDKQFILYPAGSNNSDGWAISEVSLADTPQSDKDDAEYLVCRKWADSNPEDGSVLYSANAFYAAWVFAEVSATEPNVVYVYQYTPGAYIGKFKVDMTLWFEKDGVDGVINDIDNVEVCGGNGVISVNGGEVSIYTAGGALVAKTSENISVAPGLYIANTGKRAVKVIVK